MLWYWNKICHKGLSLGVSERYIWITLLKSSAKLIYRIKAKIFEVVMEFSVMRLHQNHLRYIQTVRKNLFVLKNAAIFFLDYPFIILKFKNINCDIFKTSFPEGFHEQEWDISGLDYKYLTILFNMNMEFKSRLDIVVLHSCIRLNSVY